MPLDKVNVADFAWAEEDLLRTSRVSLYRSMKQITPNGVWGDATHATGRKGTTNLGPRM